ncbi:MAG TPA: TIGR04552 family protein, partial [Polyangiaceae bacterium]|nr:TIGR04552 family protein [Polyangiaceae bacterium]
RRHFDFPIPKPVERASVEELMLIASGKGHRQLCACTILKAMHIVHHVECRELAFSLPMSMQDVFKLVEEKVYRVIGDMLAAGFPITEFIGGRKNKDSLYTKLLSKTETTAANVYDRIRFRIVTRSADDILPTLLYLSKRVFPFNQVIPGQSLNTMFPLKSYLSQLESVRGFVPLLQLGIGDDLTQSGNTFSGKAFRAVHFVADVPVRLPREHLDNAPHAWALGPVVSVLSEFQVVDTDTEVTNELGDGSHSAYKSRQKQAVMRRLKLGTQGSSRKSDTPPRSRRRG